MICRDDLPETPEWTCEPHPCPIPCAYCKPPAATEDHLIRGVE